MGTAGDLRERFRALPNEQREAHQDYAIRLWRGISWLQRAEEQDPGDWEGRFINAWIAFNALYGKLDPDGFPEGDRAAFGEFLAGVWDLDGEGRIRRVLGKHENRVLKLIESKYLSAGFWREGDAVEPRVRQHVREALARFGTLRVLRTLFDRLYVMRLQIFHGASTKGSKLNRRTLQSCGIVLLDLLPAMTQTMLDHGIDHDWGAVCYPPRG